MKLTKATKRHLILFVVFLVAGVALKSLFEDSITIGIGLALFFLLCALYTALGKPQKEKDMQ